MTTVSRLDGWPICSPADASPTILADASARLGADVGRYPFIAVDFHHILLLLAGLPAHSLALRPAHSRRHLRDGYPGASDISSPPCLPRLLPAGAFGRVGLAPTGKRRLFTAHADNGRWPNGRKGAESAPTRVQFAGAIESRAFGCNAASGGGVGVSELDQFFARAERFKTIVGGAIGGGIITYIPSRR